MGWGVVEVEGIAGWVSVTMVVEVEAAGSLEDGTCLWNLEDGSAKRVMMSENMM